MVAMNTFYWGKSDSKIFSHHQGLNPRTLENNIVTQYATKKFYVVLVLFRKLPYAKLIWRFIKLVIASLFSLWLTKYLLTVTINKIRILKNRVRKVNHFAWRFCWYKFCIEQMNVSIEPIPSPSGVLDQDLFQTMKHKNSKAPIANNANLRTLQ